MNLIAASNLPMVVNPVLILVLAVVAGIGTLMLLPSRREAATRAIGGVVALTGLLILAAMLIRYVASQNQSMGVYFWLFAGIAVISAVRVATHRRPVYSALYFVLTTFASAGLFVLLWADFMAAALLLIYAGAILVTYIFVIMLAAKAGGRGELTEADTVSREPLAAVALGFGMMALLLIVIFDKAQVVVASAPAAADGDTSVRALARYLFANQLVNLELSGLILTLAMVGAIVISRRHVPGDAGVLTKPFIGDDNPHDIAVTGATDPRKKAYPEA
jgi:NADH-quinone oxidoreductase subunit J